MPPPEPRTVVRVAAVDVVAGHVRVGRGVPGEFERRRADGSARQPGRDIRRDAEGERLRRLADVVAGGHGHDSGAGLVRVGGRPRNPAGVRVDGHVGRRPAGEGVGGLRVGRGRDLKGGRGVDEERPARAGGDDRGLVGLVQLLTDIGRGQRVAVGVVAAQHLDAAQGIDRRGRRVDRLRQRRRHRPGVGRDVVGLHRGGRARGRAAPNDVNQAVRAEHRGAVADADLQRGDLIPGVGRDGVAVDAAGDGTAGADAAEGVKVAGAVIDR